MKLDALGEFGLIGRIAQAVRSRADVLTGIGDDAAVILTTPGTVLLTTTDMLVEGIHFDLSLTSPRHLGYKSLAVNLSDIAAMGGVPRHCYLALALPPQLSVEFVDGFMAGLLELADAHDVVLAGGDTCASAGGLVVSLTVVGEQRPDRVIGRHGARPGDELFVTGTLGDSSLGLRLLRKGIRDGLPVMRHLAPAPRLREGQLLADYGLASAMIDISDGLAADLGHLCRRSGVGARVELDSLPLSRQFREALADEGESLRDLPLSGGEDYELLFTVPAVRSDELLARFDEAGCPVTRIGTVIDGDVLLLAPNGESYVPGRNGFDHFAPSSPDEPQLP